MAEQNRYHYDVKNCYYIPGTRNADGSVTYDTSKARQEPGLMSMEAQAQGDAEKIRADGIDYIVFASNNGYNLTLNFVQISDQFKLDTEKEALQQLKEADQSPEVERQMEALQRQIVDDENALKKLTDQEKDFGSVAQQQAKVAGDQMEEFGNKVSQVGDKISGIGNGLTKGVTAPVAAVAGASVVAWKEVDEAMDIVVQKTGASGEALEGMQDSVNNIATTIPTSFEAAGTAIGEVNTRFGLTGQALEDLSKQFIEFADLNGTDVSNSVDAAQKALTAFGLGADYAAPLLDRLNAVGQKTGVSVDSLMASLVNNGAAFQELGMNIDQAAEFLGKVEMSGADSSAVMGGLSKALKNATEDGIPLNDALANLQETILNGTGSTDGLTESYDLFGKTGAQIFNAVRSGSLDFAELGAAAEDAGGSVSDTFEGTLDPLDKTQTIMNQLKVIGTDIINTAGPMIAEVLEKVAGVVETLSEKWDSLDDGQKDFIVKAALVAAAVGPVLSTIGGITSGVGGLISTGGSLISSMSGIIGTIGPLIAAAGPLLLGGAVIAGVIAGVVLIVKHWDEIKEKAGELKDKIAEKWDAIKEKTGEAWSGVKEKIGETWDNIGEKTGETWEGMKTSISETGSAIAEGAGETAALVRDTVSEKWDAVKDKTSEAWDNAKTKTSEAWDNMSLSIGEKAESIRQTAGEKFDAAKDRISSAWEQAKINTSAAWDSMKFDASNGGDNIFSKVSDKFGAIHEKIGEKMDAAKLKVQEAIDKIKEKFDFKWSLPDLKLPHIRVDEYFDIPVLGRIPNPAAMHVDWYAKAMNNPMILKKPTAFGYNPQTGSILAGGEAGDEVVSGAKTLMDMIRNVMESVQQMSDARWYNTMQQALQTATVNVAYGDVNMTVNGAKGQDVEDLATTTTRTMASSISMRTTTRRTRTATSALVCLLMIVRIACVIPRRLAKI